MTDQDNNKLIDQLLQQKQDGMYNYAKALKGIVDLGVKVGSQQTGEIVVPVSFNRYLDKYNRSNLEFEWVATFIDNRPPLYQFGPEEEHHFGDIDQSKLKAISWISNFDWPTDNIEKRVIVTLDFSTGKFEFLNGFISQEDRGALLEPATPKQLILAIKRRVSPYTGGLSPELAEYHGPTDEIFYYNRFKLGFKTEGGEKIVLIQPNGTINLIR